MTNSNPSPVTDCKLCYPNPCIGGAHRNAMIEDGEIVPNKPITPEEGKTVDEQIWVGSKEWIRREEDKKFQLAAEKMREIGKPVDYEAEVKKVWPDAHCADLSEGIYDAFHIYTSKTPNNEWLGAGITPESAWMVAHSKLPAPSTTSEPTEDGYICKKCGGSVSSGLGGLLQRCREGGWCSHIHDDRIVPPPTIGSEGGFEEWWAAFRKAEWRKVVMWGNADFAKAAWNAALAKAPQAAPEAIRPDIARVNRAADDAGMPIPYCPKCRLPLNADHTHRTYEEHDACRNQAAPEAKEES